MQLIYLRNLQQPQLLSGPLVGRPLPGASTESQQAAAASVSFYGSPSSGGYVVPAAQVQQPFCTVPSRILQPKFYASRTISATELVPEFPESRAYKYAYEYEQETTLGSRDGSCSLLYRRSESMDSGLNK